MPVVSIDRRNTLSLREKMGCGDGSEVSSRPRETLQFETPAERFKACVASAG
jgi:hypothetical protein